MEELQINPYVFFAALEMAMLFLVAALAFFIRSKLKGDQVTELQKALKKAEDVEPPEPVRYEQYLRDEVVRNQAFIDKAAASENDTGKKAGELLLMRKRFLELEVEASALENNPVAFQDCLAAGMGKLIEQLRPEPETVTETVTETVEEPVVSDTEESAEQDAERPQLDTHDEEFDRLKQVINNQHEAMSALRAELQAREAEIEDLDVILAKLDEFEQHDEQLQSCLDVLEKENQRLKEAHGNSQPSSNDKIEPMDPAQLTGLKSMLGDQQQTIHNLQTLLQELAPEASKAKELEEAIANIERANQELGSCVAVLEDENSMLRAELEAINAQLEQQEFEEKAAEEAAEEAAAAAETESDAGIELDTEEIEEIETELSEDDEKHQLEIKVEELEALVEFKDAAIEELEKQYSSLESKYMAISGEKSVD